ncbi:heme ABC exporter ATP-binding protein CcmA [Devosia sp. BK]|uniref:heme ABC exporter ATP-binding protein CcmA n=1 Tax=Devosia sp. BK TaxID=2871706 RepID=UPI00293B7A5E|nr:heme ABC exporter ATP-binding protein CcmA [Devosia sp. BK]MDV3252312.1 heme ABC exporter ATP-binding protein CcmA [Devosia sp. BK]
MTQRQVQPSLCLKTFALSVGRGETILARDLSLSVPAGTGLLLRGPNGAGKSTLLFTLAGLLPALSGTVTLEGYDEDFGPAFHHCGHKNAIRPRLTVIESVQFWQAINGSAALTPVEALERVGLGRQAKSDAGYLSAGQQRRLALARLLVSARPVWLLDEPTSALDADGQKLLAGLIEEHLASGGLAVIASHDAIAVEALAVLNLGDAV